MNSALSLLVLGAVIILITAASRRLNLIASASECPACGSKKITSIRVGPRLDVTCRGCGKEGTLI